MPSAIDHAAIDPAEPKTLEARTDAVRKNFKAIRAALAVAAAEIGALQAASGGAAAGTAFRFVDTVADLAAWPADSVEDGAYVYVVEARGWRRWSAGASVWQPDPGPAAAPGQLHFSADDTAALDTLPAAMLGAGALAYVRAERRWYEWIVPPAPRFAVAHAADLSAFPAAGLVAGALAYAVAERRWYAWQAGSSTWIAADPALRFSVSGRAALDAWPTAGLVDGARAYAEREGTWYVWQAGPGAWRPATDTARFAVATLAALNALPTAGLVDGARAYVVAEQGFRTFDAATGHWQPWTPGRWAALPRPAHRTVPTRTDLLALPTAELEPGALAYVLDDGLWFRWDATASAWTALPRDSHFSIASEAALLALPTDGLVDGVLAYVVLEDAWRRWSRTAAVWEVYDLAVPELAAFVLTRGGLADGHVGIVFDGGLRLEPTAESWYPASVPSSGLVGEWLSAGTVRSLAAVNRFVARLDMAVALATGVAVEGSVQRLQMRVYRVTAANVWVELAATTSPSLRPDWVISGPLLAPPESWPGHLALEARTAGVLFEAGDRLGLRLFHLYEVHSSLTLYLGLGGAAPSLLWSNAPITHYAEAVAATPEGGFEPANASLRVWEQPVDWIGAPPAGATIAIVPVGIPVTFAAHFGQSLAGADPAHRPAATATFGIAVQRAGATIATGAAALHPDGSYSYTLADPVEAETGDALWITAPDPADASLGSGYLLLSGRLR